MRVAVTFAAVAAALMGSSSAQFITDTSSSYPSSTTLVPVSQPITSVPSVTATGDPCAIVSSLSASYKSANPSVTKSPIIPPSAALACLQVVPLDVAKSSAYIDYLTPFLQFQSTLAYLKNPPTGYTLPGVDLIGGLGQIKQNLQNGVYNSQWAFEKDVYALVNMMVKDFHVVLPMQLTQAFTFATQFSLVSFSADGVAIPQVYVKADIDLVYASQKSGTTLQWKPSPIIAIDNQPVSDYLQTISMYGNYQDPDTLYNILFYSPALSFQGNGNTFLYSNYQLGLKDTTSYTFANDSSNPKAFPNLAYVDQNFTGINSGADLFTKAVLPPPPPTTTSTQNPSTPAPITTVTAYPTNPVALHPEFYTAGFFLEGESDVCVLAISSFAGKRSNAQALMQQTIRDTLSNCTQTGKTKLIIDVSANGGGVIFNGYDAFKQLFPSIQPFGGSRLRSTPAAQFLIDVLSQAGIYNAVNNTVYQTQANVDVNLQDFASPQAMYGPYVLAGDNFTAELRYNLSDPTQTLGTGNGIVISGYGDLSNLPPQPFEAQNIILLTDGTCGSTCSIFAELLKDQGGVRSITVGGRPQLGPMQYVAGSKGSQVYSYKFIQGISSFVPLANASIQAQGKPFPALPPPEWIPSLQNPPLGAPLGDETPNFNLRNAYKPNDASQTPTQFIYEAANCRLFYTAADLYDVSSLWRRVANVAWGNGTCVAGSSVASAGGLPAAANLTVPYSPAALSNATNPLTGPGSLGYSPPSSSSGSGTATGSAPAVTVTGKSGAGRSVVARGGVSAALVVLAALWAA